ncbi:MAG: hypothetical protein K2Y04_01655 [Caulobacteraceae bacterium]|nr:hypothetical protein [Caulobacteraceae bacterium]
MKKSRFTEAQIIGVLPEQKAELLSVFETSNRGGTDVTDIPAIFLKVTVTKP